MAHKQQHIEGHIIYYQDIDVPEIEGITDFQKKVYGVTRMIPAGSVCTYGTIAKMIRCRSSQAVGQALRRNPWPIDAKNVSTGVMVPCHRVIGASGWIGGFSGKRKGKSIERKIKLLRKEGIKFIQTKPDKHTVHNDCKHKLIKRFRKVRLKTDSSCPKITSHKT